MQSKMDSFLEVLVNVMIGVIVALAAQMVWFPYIGKPLTLNENLATSGFFTLVSLIRSYGIRRLFNGKTPWLAIKTKWQARLKS